MTTYEITNGELVEHGYRVISVAKRDQHEEYCVFLMLPRVDEKGEKTDDQPMTSR